MGPLFAILAVGWLLLAGPAQIGLGQLSSFPRDFKVSDSLVAAGS